PLCDNVFLLFYLFLTMQVCAYFGEHMFHFIYGCYETDEVRVDLVVDDDTVGYADFTKQEMVWCLPYVPPSGKDLEKEAFKFAKNSIANCHSVLAKAKKPPDLSIYTRYKAEEGVLDTLFCSANHFYPPTINFTWTKNGAEVTEGLLNLRFSHNKDGTFRGISTLSFTPQRGDVYSCWVSHEALERPRIITWGEMSHGSLLPPGGGTEACHEKVEGFATDIKNKKIIQPKENCV
uniref:Ig-like domain-containing protein n=1 Tax=Oryzias sinensis TaxID=183150 RepID=A0A8C7ZD81_9TELE